MVIDPDGDTKSDDLSEGFFSKPPDEVVRPAAPLPPLEDVVRERARFESPAFKERQRYLARYVAGAVAVSGAICIAAFFRVASAGDVREPAPHASRSVSAATTVAQVEVPERAPEPPAVPARTVPVDPVQEPAPALASAQSAPAAQPAQPAAQVATPPATSVPAAAAPAPSPLTARQEREAATHALERGAFGAAIAAADRAVRLDPGDADAWLVLGGAYQARGADAQAQRAFAACTRNARPGRSKGECASLVH